MASLFTDGRFQGLDSSGNPLSAGLLYSYAAGTLTALPTYTTQSGGVANANPVVLDSAGRASVWLGASSYRMVLKTSAGTTVWDTDNISPAESDTTIFTASGAGAVPRTTQDKLNEMVSVKDYGAVGDGTTDDTAAFLAVIATGKVGFVPFGNYKLTAALPLTEGGFVGEGFGIGGAGAQFAVLTFYNLTSTTNGAIYTRLATQKSNFARLENLYIQASSWDGTTGCLGYGLDIEAPIICDRVVVYGFKKSGVFLHQDAGGTGGPYQSLLTNVRSLYSGQHGILVGSGANAFVIQACEGKWSGAPSYGVAPSVAGAYDGLHIENTADGGGYASFIPTSVTVIGGDWSYNARYGINFVDGNGGEMGGGYAEGNLSADGMQHRAGPGMNRGHYDFGLAIAGGGGLIKIDTIDTALAQTCVIRVNGYDFAGASNALQTIMYDKQLSTADGRVRRLYLGASDVGATNSTIIQCDPDGSAYFFINGTGKFIFVDGLTAQKAIIGKRVALTYGVSVAVAANLGNLFDLSVNNGAALAITSPTDGADGQTITITVKNTSGGVMGAITWGATFKMSAWTNPANAFSRSVTFKFDGTNWVQISQTGVDVPN